MGTEQQIFVVKELWNFLWRDFVSEMMRKMQYNYKGGEEEKLAIAEGLALGKFIKNHLCIWDGGNGVSWEVAKEFLAEFADHSNQCLSVMAMLGSMPTPLVHVIFWLYNINNSTREDGLPEAFLRRITPEQIEAIRGNYQDIMIGIIPRAIIALDKKDRKKIYPDNILEKDDFRDWKSKGSWAFNFLSLDWGYPLYPYGPDDDTRAPQMNPFQKAYQFVALKDDKNSYVVNNLFGRYWHRFTNARTLFGAFPNNKAKLGSHICPAAMFTVLMHLAFFFFSPLLIVATIAMMWAGVDPRIVILCGILGGILPGIWILSMITRNGVKYLAPIFRWFFSLLPKVIQEGLIYTREGIETAWTSAKYWIHSKDKKIQEWADNNEEFANGMFLGIIGTFILIVNIFLLKNVMPFLVSVFGFADANVIVAGIYLYIGYKIWGRVKNGYFPKLQKFPVWVKVSLGVMVSVFILHFMTAYGNNGNKGGEFNPLTMAFEAVFLAWTLAILLLPKFLNKMTHEDYSRIEQRFLLGTIATISIGAIARIIQIGFSLATLKAVLTFALLMFTAILWLGVVSRWFVDPRIVAVKQTITKKLLWVFNIVENEWLLRQDKGAEVVIIKVEVIANQLFANSEVATAKMLQYINEDFLQRIQESLDYWRKLLNDGDLDETAVLDAFRLMSRGLSKETAYRAVRNDSLKRQKRAKIIKKFFCHPLWATVSAPFKWIKYLCLWIKHIATEICPGIEPQRRIEY